MTDIILYILLVGLIGTYIFVVVRRKRNEKKAIDLIEKEDKYSELQLLKEKHQRETEEKSVKQMEDHLIDYSTYKMSFKEYILYASVAIIFFGVLGYIFYESVIGIVLIGSVGLLFPRFMKNNLREKRQEKLKMQFKEAIASLSSSLAAGRSIENSFKEVVDDLYLLYPDPNTYIIREFEIINRRVENGETIENAILNFSIRSDLEDIKNFANVFITCKRTGGNLVEVIRRTSDILSEKIDIQQEVSVMIASKRFESRIMSLAPIGMILLLKTTAPDYLAPLYSWETAGPIIMTICLAILVVSYWYGQRIMNIKV
jgi:tight adherence protein B